VSPPASPSYEELAALVVDLTSRLQRAHGRIAELEARLGRDSTNSSQPPSANSIAAKARRRADRSSRERFDWITSVRVAAFGVGASNLNNP
jgi:transposase